MFHCENYSKKRLLYWLFFVTWDRDFVLKANPAPSPEANRYIAEYSEEYNSEKVLREIYNSRDVITLDEMPK